MLTPILDMHTYTCSKQNNNMYLRNTLNHLSPLTFLVGPMVQYKATVACLDILNWEW